MRTEHTNPGKRLARLVLLVSMCLHASLALAQQYRSKVLIDPSGALGKDVALSVEQLEQQLDSISDPYAKSTAGRHLARHYVEQKQYDKAINYYQQALEAEGLSDIANREILRELAKVYLISEDYDSAVTALERVLQFELVPESGDYLLLAQAYFKKQDYVGVVASLDQLQEKFPSLDVTQTRQALALYYRAGAYPQCANLLKQLLIIEPDEPQNWHQLVSIYLLLDKRRQALGQLSLAYEKAVPFGEQDLQLLVDLRAINNNPYGAATLLQQSLEAETLDSNGENYRKLFELWLQAREKDRATSALAEAARLTGDTQLYLHLAQLQMEQEAWQRMQDTMVAACQQRLDDNYVSRANLLLGISQLKLGDTAGARRSFINATLIGGASTQAGQWLHFMNAEPASKKEARRIVSLCYGSEDKRGKLSSAGAVAEEDLDEEESTLSEDTKVAGAPDIKTVKPQSMYYAEYSKPLATMGNELKTLGLRMGISLVRAGGNADGPMQLLVDNASDPDADTVDFQLALPVRGNPRGSGRYRTRVTDTFRCAYSVYQGPAEGLEHSVIELARATQEAGHELSGQLRYVFTGSSDDSADSISIEVQLGIE
jgi:tetratricopeptide (TPR) repeat protein